MDERIQRRSLAVLASVALVSIAAGLGVAPSHAEAWVDLNGQFVAYSDGRLAKTNDVFRAEAPVASVWTMTATCTSVLCDGEVVNDQGWNASAHMRNGRWTVEHLVPRAETAPPAQSGKSTLSTRRHWQASI